MPPLATPDIDCDRLDRLNEYAGVSLYVDRARLVKPDFALTAYNARAIGAICRRLEGMPLAIEMAAAWAKVLPPQRILERLEQSLDLLVSRRRDLPPRHRSLRAVCEWSYNLLGPEHQRLFASLSLFRGGWTLHAAEAVAGDDALFGLTELQNNSLIHLQTGEEKNVDAEHPSDADRAPLAEPRFRMYEALREFGLEMLEASGYKEEIARRHALWCMQLAEEARRRYRGPDEVAWISALSRERDNLRTGLHWCQQRDVDLGLQLAGALARYWEVSGALKEGSEILDIMLARSASASIAEIRSRALHGAGTLHMLQTNYARSAACHREALNLFAGLNDSKGQADALHGLGNVDYYELRYMEARERFEQSLMLYSAAGHERGMATANHSLGNVAMRLGDLEAARGYLEQAAAIRRKGGERLSLAFTVGALSQLAHSQNRLDEALAGSYEILPIFREMGVAWAAALCLGHIAAIARKQGLLRRAATLYAASHGLRSACNYPLPPAERADHEHQMQELRRSLGEADFDAAWAEGLAFTLDQAVHYALT